MPRLLPVLALPLLLDGVIVAAGKLLGAGPLRNFSLRTSEPADRDENQLYQLDANSS